MDEQKLEHYSMCNDCPHFKIYEHWGYGCSLTDRGLVKVSRREHQQRITGSGSWCGSDGGKDWYVPAWCPLDIEWRKQGGLRFIQSNRPYAE